MAKKRKSLNGKNPAIDKITQSQNAAHNYEINQEEAAALLDQKTQYQARALFRKNLSLQKRSIGPSLVQIVLPVWGLVCVHFLKSVAIENTGCLANIQIAMPIPFFFGLPLKPLSNLPGQIFNVTECNEWYLYQFGANSTKEDRTFFGHNDGTPMHRPLGSGMLSTKHQMSQPCLKEDKSVPYFVNINDVKKHDKQTINEHIFEGMELMSENYFDLLDKSAEVEGLDKIPDGAITVNEANSRQLSYVLQINDQKYYQYHRNNGVSKIGIIDPSNDKETTYMLRQVEGAMMLSERINQAYIKSIFNDTHINSGQMFMPFAVAIDKELSKISNFMGIIAFPFCLSLAMPIFLYNLVLEKELKLLENMKINGLKIQTYWKVQGAYNLAIYLISAALFVAAGRWYYEISYFADTHICMFVELLVLWGMNQVALAFFYGSFMNSAQSAFMTGYGISSWSVYVASACTQTIYALPRRMPNILMFYPTFPFVRAIYLLLDPCTWDTCYGDYDLMPQEFREMTLYLAMNFVIYTAAAVYLQQVVPQDYGVPKHPLFLFEGLIKAVSADLHLKIFGDDSILEVNKDQQELKSEDADAKAERMKVYEMEKHQYSNYPLVVKDIRKVYPGVNGRPPKVANKNICLKVENGELFGLLGPNGAGKTTLITQLTGLYPPTQGNAWIGGFDIKNQLEIVQLQIGVCPQFDIVWDVLTVEEHLLFYARIKGISPADEERMVTQALKEVHLLSFRSVLVCELPLGIKRRLSIAISLVSDPKIIFLDEPTTGLDPETRRQLWNILQEVKTAGNRAMVLTTHSMEEADVLCNRIGIVTDGLLKCIGSQSTLKQKYGGGYHLFINCDKRQGAETAVQKLVSRILPHAQLLRMFNGQMTYQVPEEGFAAEELFIQIESKKQALGICDWGISQCSLEDVFTRICELE